MDDFLDLRGYFDRESAREQPVIVSPDAAAVELAKGPYVVDVHWERGTLSLIEVRGGLSSPNIAHSPEVVLKQFRAARVEFVWGPEGSDTLLARLSLTKDPDEEGAFLLLDLRSNGHLLLLEVVRSVGAQGPVHGLPAQRPVRGSKRGKAGIDGGSRGSESVQRRARTSEEGTEDED